MSSIPHDQSSASITAASSGTVAAWLWALLGASVLAVVLLLARQASKPEATAPAAAAPVSTTAAVPAQGKPAATAPITDMDAEPLAGNPLPEYPDAVLEAGIEGDLIARLQIDSSGQVLAVSIVAHEGAQDPRLDDAAISALSQWRFHPAMRDGQAAPSVVQVPVEFRTGR